MKFKTENQPADHPNPEISRLVQYFTQINKNCTQITTGYDRASTQTVNPSPPLQTTRGIIVSLSITLMNKVITFHIVKSLRSAYGTQTE